MQTLPITAVNLKADHDLVVARQRARHIAGLLGFEEPDRIRIATVTSEIARNALHYAAGGRIEFAVETNGHAALVVTVTDRGPGIPNLDDVLAGRYTSKNGLGIGITGARRLMDDFEITSTVNAGTKVVMKKARPLHARPLERDALARIADEITRVVSDPIDEIQRQNAELLQALSELTERQEQLEQLNHELEDTNRGVLALYAELDERAETVRRADTLKTRFLSDMSHEFRTPVNAILAITRLLDEADLQPESKKQVSLIRHAAEDLESLVSDLLDLAKIEAGKTDLRLSQFEVVNLFSALRGMLRPLLVNRAVSLVFDPAEDLPPMVSDEGKVAQILRNFISNALKYTETGEVRVTATHDAEAGTMTFSVSDTGIGIAKADQERIFEEFIQIENPMQRRHKGTGLGLPLTRKLARLLGGSVGVESEDGKGSRFFVTLPVGPVAKKEVKETPAAPGRPIRLLIIDDDETARYTLRSFAVRPGTEIVEAENGEEGIVRAQEASFDMILLDLMMPGIGGHEVLQRLKDDPRTEKVPVVVVTSRFVNDDERMQILSRARGVIAKGDLSRDVVVGAIDRALSL